MYTADYTGQVFMVLLYVSANKVSHKMYLINHSQFVVGVFPR